MSLEEQKEQYISIQKRMRSQINLEQNIDHYRYIGGADLTEEDGLLVGCFVVVDCSQNLEIVYSKCTEMKVDVPYIPSLFCFREGPAVLALLNEFKSQRPDIKLDAILLDGYGEWHPRGFGLACYVGLESGIPSIGVSKSFFVLSDELSRKMVQNKANIECHEKGDYIILKHVIESGEEVSCAVMKTTDSSPFNPIYISSGHLINLESSITIVRHLCHFREPEPLRIADRVSREYVRNKKKNLNENRIIMNI